MNLNQCVLAGVLASPPERRDQLVVARVCITEETREGKQYSVYVPIEAYGQSGEALLALDEGDPVLVSGKISYRSWTDKDGRKQGGLRVSAWTVQSLAAKVM